MNLKINNVSEKWFRVLFVCFCDVLEDMKLAGTLLKTLLMCGIIQNAGGYHMIYIEIWTTKISTNIFILK